MKFVDDSATRLYLYVLTTLLFQYQPHGNLTLVAEQDWDKLEKSHKTQAALDYHISMLILST